MDGFRATIGALVLHMTSCTTIHAETILLVFEVFGFGERTMVTGTHSVNFHRSWLIGRSGDGMKCVGGSGGGRRNICGLRNNWGRNSGGVNRRSQSRKQSGKHLCDECGGSGLG